MKGRGASRAGIGFTVGDSLIEGGKMFSHGEHGGHGGEESVFWFISMNFVISVSSVVNSSIKTVISPTFLHTQQHSRVKRLRPALGFG